MQVNSISLINRFISKPVVKTTLAAVAAGLLTVSCANSNTNKTSSSKVDTEYATDVFEKSEVSASTAELKSDTETETMKNIGNIWFYKGDLDEKAPVKTMKNMRGQTEYQVTLKSGTVIGFYPNQPEDARVLDGIDLGYKGKYADAGIEFQNCNLNYIIGTDARNYYYLSYTDVDTINFRKCKDKGMKDELRIFAGSCKNIIAPDGYEFSEVGDVMSMNEGWFERAEWLDEAMHEF